MWQSEILLKDIKKLFHLHFGKMNIFTFVTSMVMVFFSVKEYLRCRIIGDVRVPGTSCRKYRSNGFHEHEAQQVKVSDVTGAKIGNCVWPGSWSPRQRWGLDVDHMGPSYLRVVKNIDALVFLISPSQAGRLELITSYFSKKKAIFSWPKNQLTRNWSELSSN